MIRVFSLLSCYGIVMAVMSLINGEWFVAALFVAGSIGAFKLAADEARRQVQTRA